MRTGLPAALLRGTPSAIRDDRFTRCPFPAATTHAPVALARSSNTAMEHRNRCTDLRHPELLATSLLKCPRQDCCETPSETKKIGKLSPFRPQLRNSIWDRSVKLSGFYRSGARHISATDLTQYLLADLIVRVENTGFSYASPGPFGSRLNRLPAWNSSLRGRR